MRRLTPKEEEILVCFWENGPMFIRELLDLQKEPKPHYNTLSTIVRILEEKGYISYTVYGNTYQYYPLISQEAYRQKSLTSLVDRYFGNSYKQVVSSLVEDDKLSVDELQELIEQIKNKKESK